MTVPADDRIPAPDVPSEPARDTAAEWSVALGELKGLGRRVRAHLDEQRVADEAATAAVGESEVGLNRSVHGAFEALGAAADDEAVRAEARTAGQALSRAASGTLLELFDMVTRAFPTAGPSTVTPHHPDAPDAPDEEPTP